MSTTTSPLIPGRGSDAAPPRAAWLGFVVVLAASVMDLLDSTIAQTAAPAIRATSAAPTPRSSGSPPPTRWPWR